MRLWDYLGEQVRDKTGTPMPLTRADLGIFVPIVLAAMIALACVFEPWSLNNSLKFSAASILFVALVCVVKYKRSVVGMACSMMCFRLILGFFVYHAMWMIVAAFVFGAITWLLLSGLQPLP